MSVGIIHVLDKQTANLIAAGEVVERPASAIKEMLENAADAGATRVTVEIKAGGTTYFRVTDNGCGMSAEDLPRCVLRHATSKIREPLDLSAIGTYGFRGEALAAIAAVSDLKILTKQKEDFIGHVLHVCGGEVLESGEAGCPDGTTIAASDIFKNVPARRKFLKKDVSEASACLAVVEKFALSRPHIAVSFLSDGILKLSTDGDGKLKNAIYNCLGKEFAAKLIPVDYTHEGISVSGYIGRPETARPSRSMQNFFVNRRYVRSGTVCAALEEGCRAFCPVGKFPAAVLFCTMDPHRVDVNIHPAKTEVKFSEEKTVFEAVLFAVKTALNKGTVYGSDSPGAFRADSPSASSRSLSEALGIGQVPKESTAYLRETPAVHDPSAKARFPSSGGGAGTETAYREKSEQVPFSSVESGFSPLNSGKVPPFENGNASVSTDSLSSEMHRSSPPSPTGSAALSCSSDRTAPPDFRNAFSDDRSGLTGVFPAAEKLTQVHSPNLFDFSGACDLPLDIPVPPVQTQEQPPGQVPKEPTGQVPREPTGQVPGELTGQVPREPAGQVPMEPEQQSLLSPSETKQTTFRIIGECFRTFILVEKGESLYLIDKHAAHERILYEEIKHAAEHNGAQVLLEPVPVRLSTEEYAALMENKEYFDGTGFSIDSFGENTVLVRAFPEHMNSADLQEVIPALAAKLAEGNGHAAGDLFDRALFTAACKAAVKAGQHNSLLQDSFIAEKIFSEEAILYCPHGRPVMTEFTKDKLYRLFKRT